MAEHEITKRRVTMKSIVLSPDGNVSLVHEATDYVRPDHLDAYVADARQRWQSVVVSEEPDAGPGGWGGVTAVPEHLDLPDAGRVYDAVNDEPDQEN